MVALNPDAGKAADGKGDILVRKVPNGVRRQNADQRVRSALNGQCRGKAFSKRAAANNDQFVDSFYDRFGLSDGGGRWA